ncbi:MAG: VCBS repeat-containing protein [Saprospiraceae bacterium]|nr:VCBS repeat-containing protein [Saprospiraceae bacterium]
MGIHNRAVSISPQGYRIMGILILSLLLSCEKAEKPETVSSAPPLFERVKAEKSGVDFNNRIEENFQNFFGVFNYVYNGAGVAIGDINNDGLADLYFTGNDVPNKLYLNQGDFQFQDITKAAGIGEPDGWDNGVVMADVNQDGWLDIYVSRGGWQHTDAQRRNLLFINNGDLTFSEQASAYGLADIGYSLQAAFFDMDNDNDLDMYLTNRPEHFFLNYQQVLAGKAKANDLYRDKLYRNDGGQFTEIGQQAGIVNNFAYGLGLNTTDVNQDGFIDIFVANDYLENDYLYINQGDGTFQEQIKQYTNHIPFYSMGMDIVDINNDGWEDIIQLDMLPADYERSKTTMASMNVQLFDDLISNGFHHQYMHNMLQLNQGSNFFSEIGQLAGISKTDWSWACLGSDFDNDGFRDILITNGFKRDIWDKDAQKKFAQFMTSPERRQQSDEENAQHIINLFQTNKITNYLYHNNQDLSFTNKAKEWGLDETSFSNGAALGDLDNDGDLDIVINNVDGEAFIYRNKAEDLNHNYLKIKLEGPEQNQNGLGAKVRLSYGEQVQFHDFKTVRGYLSSVEPILHFGLGTINSIDKIEVTWPDGKSSVLTNTPTNQTLIINYQDATLKKKNEASVEPLLADITDQAFEEPHKHQENEFDDYRIQVLLPHKLSQLGPCLTVGDVNGDGLEDFFVGGPHKQTGQIYLQVENQQFEKLTSTAFDQEQQLEDTGATFFDADGDGDLDLYVVSGGNEFQPNSRFFQDRLYLNDGQGEFELSDRLPEIRSSGSCVKAFDFDADGDLDLFVGGRLIPFNYPQAPKSFLLENREGQFIDVTDNLAPDLAHIGMVTDALWYDLEQDGTAELMLVGEWMPITIFQWRGQQYEDVTSSFSLDQTQGWWNTIEMADLDGDGDQDFLLGNLGLNYKFKASRDKPFTVFADDFDKNGTNDIFLAKINEDRMVPIRGKECSSQQLPTLNKKFTTFKDFAKADIHQILDGKTKRALRYEAKEFTSIILENDEGELTIKPLPTEAQFSTVNGILVHDLNGDNTQDLLVAGNRFEAEVETTRADSSPGTIFLKAPGATDWTKSPISESGFFVPYNVKAIQKIGLGKEGQLGILVGVNDGALQLYLANNSPKASPLTQ